MKLGKHCTYYTNLNTTKRLDIVPISCKILFVVDSSHYCEFNILDVHKVKIILFYFYCLVLLSAISRSFPWPSFARIISHLNPDDSSALYMMCSYVMMQSIIYYPSYLERHSSQRKGECFLSKTCLGIQKQHNIYALLMCTCIKAY